MHGLAMDPFPRELPPLAHHLLGMHHCLHHPHIMVPKTPKRCLFGIADPSATRAALNKIIQEEAERCVKTWEFDPIAGRPVENPKRYMWEKVAAASREETEKNRAPKSVFPSRLPSALAAGSLPGKENSVVAVSPVVDDTAPCRDSGEDRPQGRVLPVPSEAVAVVPDREVVGRGKEGRRFAPYQRQPRITEFWRQRKCSGEAKAIATSGASVGIADAETKLAAAADAH